MGGKKKKLAKNRLDKFYYMAKEQGFRSRAAFKLIQLNKKYNFLANSRTCVDLCAAPGGWLQVASKFMPVGSMIVGIDLAPIRAIPNVTAIQGDITSAKSKNEIKKNLNGKLAEVVLHDGSPNVGMSWVQDAYSQSELVLSALKLATEVLKPGGWFVTKVFRSNDYNSLIWIFNQLFKKVEATKPQASRNASAEIFVVCQEFLAPKKLDPKLLDPKFAFKEIEEAVAKPDIFAKQGKKLPRIGYEDGNTILFKKLSAADFVDSNDPIKALGDYNQIHFEDEDSQKLLAHKKTSSEIKALCNDLRVCSKGDFKNLLRWRLIMVEYKRELDGKSAASDDEENGESDEEMHDGMEQELTPEDEEERLSRELDERIAKLELMKRREKRKKAEKRKKHQRKIDMKMVLPGDDLGAQDEDDLFKLSSIRDNASLDALLDAEVPDFDFDEEDKVERDRIETEEIERELDAEEEEEDDDDYLRKIEENLNYLHQMQKELRANPRANLKIGKKQKAIVNRMIDLETLDSARKAREFQIAEKAFTPKVSGEILLSDDEAEDGDNAESSDEEDYSDESDEEESEENSKAVSKKKLQEKKQKIDLKKEIEAFKEKKKQNSLLVSEEKPEEILSKKAKMWFSQDIFQDSSLARDEDAQLDRLVKKRKPSGQDVDLSDSSDEEDQAELSGEEDDDMDMEGDNDVISEQEDDSDNDDDSHVSKQLNKKQPRKKSDKEDEDDEFEEVAKEEINDDDMDMDQRAAALALGAMLVKNRKLRDDLKDRSYNRFAFNDGEMPAWFKEEEVYHMTPSLPVTREMVAEIKQKFKELNARPIKKVAEAKARKKMKAVKKMEKVKVRAQAIADSTELTPGEKSKAIERMYKKGMRKTKEERKYVVARKNGKVSGGGQKGGGKVKVVDPRLKKDKRGGGGDQSRKKRKK